MFNANNDDAYSRVTWLASEGLTNYFKRVIQDEKVSGIEMSHSYHDFSSIPENKLYGPKTDSKGRRLSYQRAVSGEDPVLPAKYSDSTQRRRNYIPEHHEVCTHMHVEEKSDIRYQQFHTMLPWTC